MSDLTTARDHAEYAKATLANMSRESTYVVQLAIAHALTAIALATTDDMH